MACLLRRFNARISKYFKINTDNIKCKVALFTAWELINTGIIEDRFIHYKIFTDASQKLR